MEPGVWNEDENGWSRSIEIETWFAGKKLPNRSVALTTQVADYETEAPVDGWQSAAPFDAATGTTDANGKFTTTQRWNPVEADAWPHDYQVTVAGELN